MCYSVYITKTLKERITDMVYFPPKHTNIPVLSDQEAATNSALDRIEASSNPAPAAPFAAIKS